MCLKLTIKTPKQRHWCHFDVFIVNSEDILQLVLVFLFLTLNVYLPARVGLKLVKPYVSRIRESTILKTRD